MTSTSTKALDVEANKAAIAIVAKPIASKPIVAISATSQLDLSTRTTQFWASLTKEIEIYTENSFKYFKGCCHEQERPPRNPFFHRLNYNALHWFETILLTPILFPIRLILVLLLLILAWFFACITLCGISLKKLCSARMSPCRRLFRTLSHFTLRCSFFVLGFFWVTIKGKRAKPQDAPILVVAPHSTLFDTLILLAMGSPTPSVVSKSEIHDFPLVGKMVDVTQPVYVHRGNSDSRRTAAREIKNRVKAPPDQMWTQIFIFPEGTCANRKYLLKFKLGAFLPGVPIQPVIVKWPNKCDSMAWALDGPSAPTLFWLSTTQFFHRICLEFLPVYQPSPEEQKDARLYARNIQVLMGKASGIPTSDYEYEDTIIYAEIQENGLQKHLSKLWNIWSKYKGQREKLTTAPGLEIFMEINVISEHLKNSISMSNMSLFPWLVSQKEFPNMFKWNKDNKGALIAKKLFSLYKVEMLGHIDVRDYFIHLLVLNYPKISTLRLSAVIFALYGDHSGKLMVKSVIVATMNRLFRLSHDQVSAILYRDAKRNQNQSEAGTTGTRITESDRESQMDSSKTDLAITKHNDHDDDGIIISLEEFQLKMRKTLQIVLFMAFEGSGRL